MAEVLDHEDNETDLSVIATRLLGVLIRRRWLIASTATVVVLGIIAVSMRLPNRYTSEATILAVQQRVPERYVAPTATTDPTQALEAMVQESLSRPRLLSVIDELGLHPEERKRLKPEELITLVRRDLTIEPLERMLGGRGDVNAFKISFVADSPQLAQQVTKRLTTLFIEQNLKTRADQAVTTTEFLHEQLESAKQQLHEQEQRLRDFKMQFLGELPEQQQSNLGILTNVQSQLDNVMASRNQAQQQRLYLESMVGEYERRGKRTGLVRSEAGEVLPPLQLAENELVQLEKQMKSLLAVYTSSHPDVLRKQKEIERQRAQVQGVRSVKLVAAEPGSGSVEASSDSQQDMLVAQLKSQLRANHLEVENLAQKEQKLRQEIELYQSRLNLTPVREQQLTSIQRDYDLIKAHYGELLKKQQESQLATDLEKRQDGQQFRLADPPNFPTVPSSPKRFKISVMGLFGGVVLGCALAFLIDFKYSPFLTEDHAARKLKLPLTVGIPLVLTTADVRARSSRRIVESCAAIATLLLIAYVEMYVYRCG